PSKDSVIRSLKDLLTILFPGYQGNTVITQSNIRPYTDKTLRRVHRRLMREIDRSLKYVCIRELKCPTDVCHRLAEIVVGDFLESIPSIRDLLKGDIQAAYDGDPAARNVDEIILSYPCVLAISTYRIAHELHIRGVPLVPRIMSEYAHSVTGIDIHPGAKIGRNFFIDHGTGVVVGETTEIGNSVRIYQGVTLGAMSIPRGGQTIRGKKRHPTIEDDVIIYSGATILGGDTVIGRGSVIGVNVWVTSSLPRNTIVTISPPELVYKNLTTAHSMQDHPS
ncbi:serine acetyltransferase, partial [Candidatus Bathyarchaeota archaeon]|nr:serine acetyltransferase [Candidatus Bathyarchaeota archaeon]